MAICHSCLRGGAANKELVRLIDEGDLDGADKARVVSMEFHSQCVGEQACFCQHAVGYGLIARSH